MLTTIKELSLFLFLSLPSHLSFSFSPRSYIFSLHLPDVDLYQFKKNVVGGEKDTVIKFCGRS